MNTGFNVENGLEPNDSRAFKMGAIPVAGMSHISLIHHPTLMATVVSSAMVPALQTGEALLTPG